MTTTDEYDSGLTEETLARLEQAAERFEAAYEAGQRPEIDAYLPADAAERRELLTHLVHIDLERRLKAGEAARVEAYLGRYPELAGTPAVVLGLAAAEYRLRRRGDPAVAAAEYLARFPHLAGRLGPPPDTSGDATAPHRPPAGAAVGELPSIPGYEVLRELGRGGMGVVYLARQAGVNRLVALKMILAGEFAGARERARFRAEAEAAGRMQHPHIVAVHEVGEVKGRPYLALEYVDGGSLRRRLDGGLLSPRESAALLETVARAVHAAHQRGIVHRDLTPANVLLTADGVPKVSDFGLAKLLAAGGTQTQTGALLGTPSYVAPEQAAGEVKRVGPAADVYSLGAILYECLTGRPPFRAETRLETLLQVQIAEPTPPRRLKGQSPRDLETVCLKCLHKEPGRRYATAEALADDLQRCLAGEPIHARPVGAPERAWRWARRNPGWAVMLTAVAGLLLLIAVGSSLMTLRLNEALGVSEQEREQAAAEKRKAEAEGKRAAAEKRKAEEQQRQADARRREAELLSTRLLMEQGLTRCEQGQYGRGLLGLARALEVAPADAPALQQSLRRLLGGWNTQLHPLRVILPHQGPVCSVAFSPDGKTIVTGSWRGLGARAISGEAQLWESATGRPVGEPLRHQAEVHAVAFSPDGKTVLTGSHDKTARLWESATGRPVGEPLRHQDKVGAVAFSPDGKTVLTGSWDKTARLWESATGRPVGEPLRHQDKVGAVAFSPDGKTVLTGSDDKTARLWESATGRPVGEPLGHQVGVYAVAFSPDGKTLLTGTLFEARRWAVGTGKPLEGPLRHEGYVVAAAFSPDGRIILTGGGTNGRGEARLWEATTGRPIGEPLRHQSQVTSVSFSPDGRVALTGSEDNMARLWEVTAGDGVVELANYPSPLGAAAFSPDGRLVLTGSYNEARLWEVTTGRPVGEPLRHQGGVQAVAFSPDGKFALTGCRDRTVRVWESATGRPVGEPLCHPEPVVRIACSPDGKTALTMCQGKAWLWDVLTARPSFEPLLDDPPITAAAFSPDGKTFLTGGRKGARLWETASGKPLGLLLPHSEAILALAFSPDGKTVLTGAGKEGRLWEMPSCKACGPPLLHHGRVGAVAFSPDGRLALTGSGDLFGGGEVRLWDAATASAMVAPLRFPGAASAIAFSPDGKTVLARSNPGVVRLWKVPAPLPGEVERLKLWLQVDTGLELDASGAVVVLDEDAWRQRLTRLQELGGLTLP